DVGIGSRAGFYDKTGAARDVLQNHLFQLLALTAMEEPVEFTAEAIRTEKMKVLRAVTLPKDLGAYAIRGQYEQGWLAGVRVPGYRQEPDVPARSTTETYAAVQVGIETGRWAGVRFYLRTGKRLPRRVTEIAVIFRKAPHLPFAATDTEKLGHNQLVIRVQPDEGVTMKFGSKVPGSSMEVRDVAMDFLYGEQFTESSPEAYERLILDVLLGDATLFPRNVEVEASWKVIDPLEEFWGPTTPYPYRAGEWGPKEADQMLARDGRAWRRPCPTAGSTAAGPTCRPACGLTGRGGGHDDPVGHHRYRGGQGTGRGAAQRRVGDLRLRADPGGRGGRAGRRCGGGGCGQGGPAAPAAAADRDPPAVRGTGPPAGRRGHHRRPARAGRVGGDADVRAAVAAQRVGGAAAARPRRTRRHLVARPAAGEDRVRPARGVRRPPDHRLRPGRRSAHRAGAAGSGLH